MKIITHHDEAIAESIGRLGLLQHGIDLLRHRTFTSDAQILAAIEQVEQAFKNLDTVLHDAMDPEVYEAIEAGATAGARIGDDGDE